VRLASRPSFAWESNNLARKTMGEIERDKNKKGKGQLQAGLICKKW
jgi:hypothetical protein